MSATLGLATLGTEVDLKGLTAGLKDAENSTDSMIGRASSAFKGLGGIVTAGIAAATTAVVGLAVAGGMAFVGFENQMNEVFTLLPGISEQAMGQMQEDVKDLSREFGVLPNEVVPALYQALSAGVPQDNVFEFLEIATKASIGGITELETAVDGITSVVNAYGAEIIDAQRASDVMFTAVRLGKTDFEQLSSSLFNVIPTAASLGISFEEVSAGLATLTAQGTPTSVATTQLRQLFNELSKSGGDLAFVIEEQTGKSFSQLVGEGRSVASILQDVRASMSTDEFRNMFSSVEALNAALGTTGPNFEGMMDNMDDMFDSVGATDAAFETMSNGMQFAIDRMKAFGQTALLDIGAALAPVIGLVLDFAEDALPKITAVLQEGVIPAIQIGIQTVGDFIQAFQDGTTPLNDFIDTAIEIVGPVIAAIAQFVEWQDVLLALGIAVGAVVIPIIWGILSPILAIVAIAAVVIGAIALMRAAWENDWGGVQTKIMAVWAWMSATLMPFLQDIVFPWLQERIPAALQTLSDFWTNTLLPAIERVWEFLTQDMMPIWQALDELLGVAIPLVLTALQGIWENVLLPAMTSVWEFLTDKLGPAFEWLKDTIIGPVTSSFGGLGSVIESVAGFISGLADGLSNMTLPSWMTPGSPTPWEMGLRGVRKELQSLSRTGLPEFNAQISSVQGSAVSPGMAESGLMATPAMATNGATTYSFDFRGAVIRSQRDLEDMIDQALRKVGAQADNRIRMT